MAKLKFEKIGMNDPMERLYYERAARRRQAYDAKKAYDAGKRRPSAKNRKEPAMSFRTGRQGFSQVSSAAI